MSNSSCYSFSCDGLFVNGRRRLIYRICLNLPADLFIYRIFIIFEINIILSDLLNVSHELKIFFKREQKMCRRHTDHHIFLLSLENRAKNANDLLTLHLF